MDLSDLRRICDDYPHRNGRETFQATFNTVLVGLLLDCVGKGNFLHDAERGSEGYVIDAAFEAYGESRGALESYLKERGA